ncbi:hypothetical protein [Nocardia terpenica]|uniref:AbrB/MazE/SpoVT family DNA-binding domain-containing protein n=1 Tax=Nocardia terpenica TaxID=455432 RepID=A0A164LSR4_9NOCA|nr:hypothetical protein [Nocardia terpenica]KZM72711.1 hypothetical protein AWN90_28430 [Nocardia terpenica]NQE92384.1 hypothetical protein [Nocardia terpenica]
MAVSRLDRSGRFRAHRLLRALGWSPGQRLRLRVDGSMTVIVPDRAGVRAVTARGVLALPVAVRRFTGLDDGPVVAVAVPARELMFVVPVGALVSALIERLDNGHDR